MSLPQPLIHRLPDDALLEIFGAYYGILQPHFTLSDALRLSSACRLWRATARRLQCLWSHLELDIMNPEVDHRAAYWLGLTKQSNLFIKIGASFRGARNFPLPGYRMEETDEALEARLVRLAQILQPCTPRWELFSIQLEEQDIDLFLRHCSTNDHVPNLKVFKAHFMRNEGHPLQPVRLWNIPYDRPPNSKADISVCCDYSIPVFTATFGWAITSVSVAIGYVRATADDLLGVLRLCPNMVEFEIFSHSEYIDAPAATSPGPIQLLHLRRISISGLINVDYILASLCLPSLEFFEAHHMDWTTPIIGTIVETLRNCSPSLSHVSATGYHHGPFSDDIPFDTEPVTLSSLRHCCIRPPALDTGDRLIQQLILPHVEILDIANVRLDLAHPIISSSDRLHSLTLDDVCGPVPQLILPTLTSLNIGTSMHLLHTLRTPQLTNLTLRGEDYTADQTSAQPLRYFLDRVTPPLQVLQLQRVDMSDEQFLWCMGRLTELESLELTYTNITDAAFSTLAEPLPAGDGMPLHWSLPRLTKIEVSSNYHLGPPGLIKFIASRNGSAPATVGRPARLEGSAFFHPSANRRDREIIESYGIRATPQ
ncbi:hypothetical protein BOTBODRAFT_69713 [Botryobasidium botryosum FD-172 SS1]|uniref:Uncharacterized protein n=1 Tax=Botryobasidium botryosum (strain FD-172 SS1) TaxID=930990 RepID=A0A067M9J2_BOTB1|nr:hypothetical protein BOTBODRAFT_69713 [Botryobasidium botryosum FD-172 SS1]